MQQMGVAEVPYAPIRVQFMQEMGVAEVPYAPIRVQFIQVMGVAEVSICTNQSSVYTGDGCGRGFHMHQSEFSLHR